MKPSHLQQRPYRITSNFHNDLIFPFFNDLFHMAKYSIHKKKISGIVCYKKIFKLKKILTEKKCSQQKNNIYGILINPLYIFQAADKFHTVTIKLSFSNTLPLHTCVIDFHKSLRAFNIVPIILTITLMTTTVSN